MNYLLKKLDDRTYQRRTIIWCKFMYLRAFIKNGFKKKTILFYPDKPRMWHILYPICHILGYSMTENPNSHFDIAMAFEDITMRTENQTLLALSKRYNVLNSRCGDISKERVGKVFLESFGYNLSIDPRTYKGRYIKKSDLNDKKNAEMVEKPSEPEKGFVYQKFIDNQTDKDSATDIRTFIFGDTIPFTLYRKRSIHDRFKDDTVVATRVETDAAFTKAEQAAIIRFCKAFGLDYGELDVLRDNKDGKIYIVDVNNTPSGPRSGVHMKREDYDRFVAELAGAFEGMIRKLSFIGKQYVS